MRLAQHASVPRVGSARDVGITPRRAARSAALVVAAGALVRFLAPDLAVTDLARLYDLRHISAGAPPYFAHGLEYPSVTGLVIYLGGLTGNTARARFLANTVMLVAAAAAIGYALGRKRPATAMRFSRAPTLALYGTLNWDLIAVLPATVGLLAAESGALIAAGVLLGLGASAKLYPGLFVPVIAAGRWARGDRRGAATVSAAAIVTIAACNVPLAFAPGAFDFFFHFHGRRPPTWGTLSFYATRTPRMEPWVARADLPTIGTVITVVVTAGVLAWCTVACLRRRLDPMPACAVVLIGFLLANKVYSPQYDLWLLPFFALVPLSRTRYRQFIAVDAAMFVVVWGVVGAFGLDHHRAAPYVIGPVVLLRALVLLATARDLVKLSAGAPTTTSPSEQTPAARPSLHR
ncbi:MAG TPA: glycosyltransferase 87 family protein [Acidimicrobiia bacterium]